MYNLKTILGVLYGFFIVYAVYASLAVFISPTNRGQLFKQLKIPIVVFLYFLLPCAALYMLFRAFATTYPAIFWAAAISLGGLSYFIFLCFVTAPDWPVGKALGLEKVSERAIRVALVVNFALASFVLAGSGITLHLLPHAIENSSQQPAYTQVVITAQKLDAAIQQNTLQKIRIEQAATLDIWTKRTKLVGTVFTTISGFIGLVAAIIGMRKSKDAK